MDTCKACGTILPFSGMKCPRCGYSKDETGAAGGDASATIKPFNTEKHVLIMNLTKLRDLLGENEELETMIKPQSEFPSSDEKIYKKRSLMRFFWPFLVGGIGAGFLIYCISLFIMFSSMVDASSRDHISSQEAQTLVNNAMGDIYGGFIVAVIVAVAIIIIGVKISRRKRDDINSNADMMNRIAAERYQMGLKNEKLIDLYQSNLGNIKRYENLVPPEYRTSRKVNLIIECLKEDKATTVEEAIAQIGAVE